MEREGIESGCYAISGLAATNNETDQRETNLSRACRAALNTRSVPSPTGPTSSSSLVGLTNGTGDAIA